MAEDLNNDLFWGPQWPGNWASKANIQDTTKVAQIAIYTKTDVKPVEFFLRKWPKTRIFTYLGAQRS